MRTAAFAGWLAAGIGAVALAGLAAGADGWSLRGAGDAALIAAIRAPRTAGALLVGACLGWAGALAQGLFRNPLADPYLLGSASGAALAVTAVAAAGALTGAGPVLLAADLLVRVGLTGAAFVGALAGVWLTLALAGGAGRPTVLLLAGVVVAVMAAALADLLVLRAPEALRGRHAFMLGSTAFLGWPAVAALAAVLGACLWVGRRLGRSLDALVLGEWGAASLGVRVEWLRRTGIAMLALATGAAVAHAGLVGFVGLAAPHLARRMVTVTHGPLLALSAATGALLLGAADAAARSVLAPVEIPVGVLTALLGGAYLLVLLHRRATA
jgi:iron complex transport system permease protein